MLIPELIQEDFKAEKIFNAALNIIEDNSTKNDIMLGYKKLKDKLGKPGVTDRASKYILDLIAQMITMTKIFETNSILYAFASLIFFPVANLC